MPLKICEPGWKPVPTMIWGKTSKTKTANNKVGVPALAFV